MADFQTVLSKCGRKPDLGEGQNATRHYSENFSREAVLWLRDLLTSHQIGSHVLQPEGKVDTIYEKGNRGKSLDVIAVVRRSRALVNEFIINYSHESSAKTILIEPMCNTMFKKHLDALRSNEQYVD